MKYIKVISKSFVIIFICFLSTNTFAQIKQTSGKLSLLRVHEVGSKYGPATDQIDAEVIIKFKNSPNKAYGFQLRNDNNKLVRNAMLNILRDAFSQNYTVTIDYKTRSANDVSPAKKNGIIIRVWITKSKQIIGNTAILNNKL